MGKRATECLPKVEEVLDQFDCLMLPSVKLGGEAGIVPQIQFKVKPREVLHADK